jgi:hypothetical protein
MFTTNDFIPTAYSHNIEVASSSGLHQAICFGKILGKRTIKFRKSISQFTLNNCKTITKLAFKESTDTFFL